MNVGGYRKPRNVEIRKAAYEGGVRRTWEPGTRGLLQTRNVVDSIWCFRTRTRPSAPTLGAGALFLLQFVSVEIPASDELRWESFVRKEPPPGPYEWQGILYAYDIA